jgi:hypothetical protein
MSRDLDELLSEAIAAAEPDISERIATDPAAYLDLVVLAARANARTGTLLHDAVSSARSAGHSWEAIGQVLAMSRQAAQQRFGRSPSTEDSTSGDETRRLSGLNAFNEMEALHSAGRHGWHSVEFGPLFHVVSRSPWQWEHQRVYVVGASRRALEADGWQRIGTHWFPWAYYKRQLDKPALPD